MKKAAMLGVVLVAGCAVGPDFRRPAAPAVESYLPSAPPGSSGAPESVPAARMGVDGPAAWWSVFDSPDLDALVAAALRANPTVAEAQANLRIARETLAAQRGSYYPAVTGSGEASRQRDAVDVLSPTLTSGTAVFSLYTAQVNVSYTLDVFGLNRRLVESAAATADASRWQLEATSLTVAGNVVTAALQLAGTDEQIAATRQSIALEQQLLGIVRRQQAAGAVSGIDVAAQETLLAQTEATLPSLERQRETLRHLLAVLLGRLPPDAPVSTPSLAALRLPAEVPVGIPSDLVTRRPDVRAAESELHSATADVGVARANLLPQLTLDGALGSAATRTPSLFRSYTKFWTAGATLSQTLFEGGTLWHRSRAADAALDAAGARYRQAVLAAFQNVADSLRALQSDAATLAAADRAAAAAARSLAIVRRQLELGGVGTIALLNAEAADAQARATRAAALTAQYVDTAALCQAVAGPVPASP